MMSMDKQVVSRRVYSVGDWLNEVGGYSSCLVLAVQLMLPLLRTFTLNKFLIQELYKMQPEDQFEDSTAR